MGLFGRTDEELERLRAAVRMLGTTSVPGLSAALSWREHKTEKLLAVELGRPGTQVIYEPSRRLVRFAHPPAPEPPPPVETPAPVPILPEAGALPPRPAPLVLKGSVLRAQCPTCHVPLLSTGSTNLSVCPECGRLSTERAPDAAAPAPPVVAVAGDGGSRPPTALTDRRSQELFAAYVTSRPIPCPKCRTPLRHRGVSEYVCPSCGQLIRFPQAVGPGAVVTAPPLPQP
jgi:hypothetical protein